jgi:hypothetical protein
LQLPPLLSESSPKHDLVTLVCVDRPHALDIYHPMDNLDRDTLIVGRFPINYPSDLGQVFPQAGRTSDSNMVHSPCSLHRRTRSDALALPSTGVEHIIQELDGDLIAAKDFIAKIGCRCDSVEILKLG